MRRGVLSAAAWSAGSLQQLAVTLPCGLGQQEAFEVDRVGSMLGPLPTDQCEDSTSNEDNIRSIRSEVLDSETSVPEHRRRRAGSLAGA